MSAPYVGADARGGKVHTHGAGGYSRGCRCETCRSGRAQAVRDQRAAAAARRIAAEAAGQVYVAAGITHGTISGYQNASCRCEPCRLAAMAHKRGTYTSPLAVQSEPAASCVRCKTDAPDGACCSSHGKTLCHRCYRLTHFVGRCGEGCSRCAREGLDPMTWPERVKVGAR